MMVGGGDVVSRSFAYWPYPGLIVSLSGCCVIVVTPNVHLMHCL